jgi:hypothetical protein
MENSETTSPNLNDNLYLKSLKYVSDYQKRHPEKMREKNKRHYKKIKETNPEKYEEFKKKALENYYKVRKPKLEEAKRQYLLSKQ